ncbi:hypothetical protein [Maribacter luteus]|uniref:hypothetical protein n=1 Tax=Maribacter luteus TaxID=2594478 RepID=UPI002491D24D|nr:hypothetical protein [Maribacter luteus]
MKNSIRIFSVTVLMTIYCIAVHVVRTNTFIPDVTKSTTTDLGEQHTFVTNNLYGHFSVFESSIESFNFLPEPNFENPIAKIWSSTKGSDQLLNAVYTQYRNFLKGAPIQLRATDIIFPFHYFW